MCGLALALQVDALAMGQKSAHRRSQIEETIQVGARRRVFRLYVPSSYTAHSSPPLVIVLHGGGGTAAAMEGFTVGGFNDLAETEGFLVAYPDAVHYPVAKPNWNDGRNISWYPSQRDQVDDVRFISALIDHLAAAYHIDTRRVYVTGASNGGIMSNRLGCELAEKVAAIAPVIGLLAAPLAPHCAPSRAVSVLMINGTDDPLMPWNGGDVRLGRQRLGRVISVPETVTFWVTHNGCVGKPLTTILPDRDHTDGTRVHREVYQGCRDDTEVILYTIEGGGHTWPGAYQYAPISIVGRTSQDINACRVIWEFFKRHARSTAGPGT